MLSLVRRRVRALGSRLLGRTDPIILMYHRVERLGCDPWKLAVTPEHFSEQLDVLTRRRTIVPLAWLVAELEAGRVPDRAVVLTFDDGYVDVLRNAQPILERFDAPATVYLTTGMIGRAEFWWDALARIVLEAPSLPETLALELAGRAHAWPTADRTALHLAVWGTLVPLAPEEREHALAVLAQQAAAAAPVPALRDRDRALDPEEVRTLAAGRLIAIGAHTVSHASLPTLSAGEQRHEMGTSRTECERLLGGAPVTAFAYPFGNYDAESVRLARTLGFRHACTTEWGVAASAHDRFRLPRLGVENWGADELERNVLGAA